MKPFEKHEARSLFPNVKKYRGARVSHQTCEKIRKD